VAAEEEGLEEDSLDLRGCARVVSQDRRVAPPQSRRVARKGDVTRWGTSPSSSTSSSGVPSLPSQLFDSPSPAAYAYPYSSTPFVGTMAPMSFRGGLHWVLICSNARAGLRKGRAWPLSTPGVRHSSTHNDASRPVRCKRSSASSPLMQARSTFCSGYIFAPMCTVRCMGYLAHKKTRPSPRTP